MKKLYLTAVGIFMLIYIVPLGIRPIILPDESRYAEIPREMLASGNWIVPKFDGLRYFEKPVLGYWLNALSIKLFGENAFGARFPSALATGLSAFIIFLLVYRFAGDITAAIAAALIFLTSFIVYGIGTFNVLDSMLAVFITASMASFFSPILPEHQTKKSRVFFFFSVFFAGWHFLPRVFWRLPFRCWSSFRL